MHTFIFFTQALGLAGFLLAAGVGIMALIDIYRNR